VRDLERIESPNGQRKGPPRGLTAEERGSFVHADLDTVTARCAGTVAAGHSLAWTRQQTITDPGHVSTAARLGTALRTPPRTAPPPAGDDQIEGPGARPG
jgi:hypothetical protein